jgi:chromatin segregation and condensation protein Rec8/ScpA/Scc1 (kleisin family)
VYMEIVLARLQAEQRLPFSALFTPPYTRGRLVGLFLAILELTKRRHVIPEQPDPLGDIWVALSDKVSADGPLSPEIPETPENPPPLSGE